MSDLIDRKFAIDSLMVVKRQNKAKGQILCADEDAILAWLKALPSAEHPTDPAAFAESMRKASATDDEEVSHRTMDGLMCDLLRELGYDEAVEIFEDAPKWYA